MTREETVAFFDRRWELGRRQDAAALTLLHTEDGVIESPLAGGFAQGREAIEHVYQTFFDAFSLTTLNQEALFVDGNKAVSIVHMDGIDRGGLLGVHASGRSYSLSMVWVCEFRDGLIARERRIYDFTGLLIQVGAIKAKPV